MKCPIEAKIDDNDDNYVPRTWTFLGFMAFVLWGPFADPDDRLKIVLVNVLSKSELKSRSEMRKN